MQTETQNQAESPEESNFNQMVTEALAQYDVADAKIAELGELYFPLEADGPEDKEGLAVVKKARLHMRNLRTTVEKKRKQLKAESLEYGKRVDNEAKRIIGLMLPIEEHLLAEEEKVAEELERRAAEEARKLKRKIGARYRALQEMGLHYNTDEVGALDDEEWEEYLEGALAEAAELKRREEAKEAARKEAAEAAAKAKAEAQRARAEARAQIEKAQAEADEAKREADEARAELAAMKKKEQDQEDAKLEAQRAQERAEADADAAKAEAAAAKARAAREKAEAEAAEANRKLEESRKKSAEDRKDNERDGETLERLVSAMRFSGADTVHLRQLVRVGDALEKGRNGWTKGFWETPLVAVKDQEEA